MTSAILESLPQQLISAWEELQRRVGSKRLLLMLNIIALALLTHSIASWTWRFVQPDLPKVHISPGSNTTQANRLDLNALLQAHLFGQADQPAENQEVAHDLIPLSSLNLQLTGVVVAGDQSIALISSSEQPQTPYLIGEEIAHGAVLHAVYPDRAILMRAGVLESLVLEENESQLNKGSFSARPSPARPRKPTLPQSIRRLGNNSYSLPRSMITEQTRNPNFLRQAHIIPRGNGFFVRKISPGSLYEQLGLRQGDVIQSINGEPVKSLQDAMRHYQNLDTLSRVQLQVLRNGQSQMLQFNLE